MAAKAHGKVAVRLITVKLRTSRKGAEALRLEIRQLAGRLGIPAAAVQIRRVHDGRA